MRKVFVVCLFSIIPIISSFSQSESDTLRPPIYSLTLDEMVSWMDSTTSFWMDSVDIPGMVVSIVAGDSIVMQKGYGHINKEKTAQVDASASPFRIASISKTFTALAALQLVSEGKLDLNKDVSKYIDFEIDRYHNGKITLYHLLTHSAGLDEKILGGGTLDKTEVPKLDQFLSSSMPAQIREPGMTFSYSNMGYTLAGYLAELQSGKPFHQYLSELILNPLNMNHTSFWRGGDPIYSESKSYFLDSKAFKEYPQYEILSYPSGGMISTGEDISKYMLMILNDGSYNGQQIVSPEVIDLFTQPVFTQDERLSGVRSYGFFNWNINGVNFINHGGSIEGYRSQLYLFPDNKVGLFIATNSSWGGWINSEIGRAFRKYWLELSETKIDTAVSKGMPGNAEDIAGDYFRTRSPQKSIMKIGRLTNWTLDARFDEDGYMFIEGDPETKYAETAPLAYSLASPKKDAASKIIFKENDNGEVKYMLTSGFNSYFKLKWWETTKVHLIYSMTLFTIFILFLLYNLIHLFRKNSPDANTGYRRAYNCSVTATLFHVITFLTIGFYLYISDGLVFDFGLPWFLKLLLVLPLISIVCTVYSLVKLKAVLNERSISKTRKIIFMINLFALVLILPFMHYWNLIGFNF